jgi:uridine kinase
MLLDDIALLLNEKLLKLEGDGEHKWERGDVNWQRYTHLDPKANFIYKQASIISQLKENSPVYRIDYDHNTGKFTSPLKVEPKEFITISALHPFYLSYMRNKIDLKIYLDTDESLRRHWKVIRDMDSRGYSKDKIIHQIEMRVDDTKRYIYPQKRFANLVIRYYPLQEFELGNRDATINLGLKLTFSADIQIDKLLDTLGIDIEWDYNDDLNTQHIDLKKEPDIDFKKLSNSMIDDADEITAYKHRWLHGYRGLIQLFVLLNISKIIKGR